mgnify:CR=1 FL=1
MVKFGTKCYSQNIINYNILMDEILQLIKKLANENLEVNSSGNISFRLDPKKILIKPAGLSYREVNKKNISVVDFNEKLISGLKPSSDLSSHLAIYKNRPDINCIIHTHSHFATIFATIGKSIKITNTLHADYFGEKIICLPYINHKVKNFGIQLLQSKKDVALLEKHGAVVIGSDYKNTIKKVIALEEISKLNYHLMILPGSKKNTRELKKKDIYILNQAYR